MARRRADVPMAVLLMGLFTVILFGVGIVHFTARTPILRLPPALAQEFGVAGFQARFHGGAVPAIEVRVPPEALPGQPNRLQQVGLFALGKYRELAKVTRVATCRVRPRGDKQATPVEVSLSMVKHDQRARKELKLLVEAVREDGVKEPAIEIVGVSRRGVQLRVHGVLRTPREVSAPEQTARHVADLLLGQSFVAWVHVDLQVKDRTVSLEAGEDPNAPIPRPVHRIPTPR